MALRKKYGLPVFHAVNPSVSPTEKQDKTFLLAILGEWVCLAEVLASVFFAFLEMRQLLSLLIVYRL